MMRCGCYPIADGYIGYRYQPLFSQYYYEQGSLCNPGEYFELPRNILRVIDPKCSESISIHVKEGTYGYDMVVNNGKRTVKNICDVFRCINSIEDLYNTYMCFDAPSMEYEGHPPNKLSSGFIHTLLFLRKCDECLAYMKKYQQLMSLDFDKKYSSANIFEHEFKNCQRITERYIKSYDGYIKLLERRDEAEIGDVLLAGYAMTFTVLEALGVDTDNLSYGFIADAFPQSGFICI